MLNTGPSTDALSGGMTEEPARGDLGDALCLLESHRDRLRRMIAARLDRRLVARLDPSDVVQETLTDATRRLPDFVRDRPMPFLAWLFRLAADRLARTHRDHVVTSARAIGREGRVAGGVRSGPESRWNVDRLMDPAPTPGCRMVREEHRLLLARAIERMGEADREILGLRYGDRLAFEEIASTLEIGLSAAKMRHLRALERLRPLLEEMGMEPSTGP